MADLSAVARYLADLLSGGQIMGSAPEGLRIPGSVVRQPAPAPEPAQDTYSTGTPWDVESAYKQAMANMTPNYGPSLGGSFNVPFTEKAKNSLSGLSAIGNDMLMYRGGIGKPELPGKLPKIKGERGVTQQAPASMFDLLRSGGKQVQRATPQELNDLAMRAKTDPNAMNELVEKLQPFVYSLAESQVTGHKNTSHDLINDLMQEFNFRIPRLVERFDPNTRTQSGQPVNFTSYLSSQRDAIRRYKLRATSPGGFSGDDKRMSQIHKDASTVEYSEPLDKSIKTEHGEGAPTLTAGTRDEPAAIQEGNINFADPTQTARYQAIEGTAPEIPQLDPSQTARLQEIIRRMPEQQRRTIELRLGLGDSEPLNAVQIAQQLGVNTARGYQLVKSAEQRLFKELATQPDLLEAGKARMRAMGEVPPELGNLSQYAPKKRGGPAKPLGRQGPPSSPPPISGGSAGSPFEDWQQYMSDWSGATASGDVNLPPPMRQVTGRKADVTDQLGVGRLKQGPVEPDPETIRQLRTKQNPMNWLADEGYDESTLDPEALRLIERDMRSEDYAHTALNRAGHNSIFEPWSHIEGMPLIAPSPGDSRPIMTIKGDSWLGPIPQSPPPPISGSSGLSDATGLSQLSPQELDYALRRLRSMGLITNY